MQRPTSFAASDVSDIKELPRRSTTATSNKFRSAVADSHARTFAVVQQTAPETPKEVHNARIYLVAFTLCMGAAAYGYDTGFFGGTIALDSFQRAFGIADKSDDEKDAIDANLVSLFQGGSFFGAALQLPVTQFFGRKWAIILSNIIFILSAFLQVFSNGSIPLMMGGRFVGGFAIGISSLVIPVYLSEFSPAPIRGRMVGFFDVFIQIGTIFGFWANYIISNTVSEESKFQWQFPLAAQLFPAGLLALGMFFVPETPRFLIQKKRFEQAEKNLTILRKLPADHVYIQWEMQQTRDQIELEERVQGKVNTWELLKELFHSRGHRTRLLLGLILLFFKTFSGVQAINYYSPRIFRDQLGFTGKGSALFATGVYGSVKVACTLIFGLFVVDRVGRRKPLIFGALAGALCLFFMGGYINAAPPHEGRSAGDYAAIVAIYLYAAIYCFGYNSVPLTYISEIFTLRFRTISMTMCLMWQWLCTFAVVRIMPASLTAINERTFFIFGSIFCCSTPFVYFFLPETKGLPLEAMDHLFGGVDRTPEEQVIVETLEKDKPMVSHTEHVGAQTEAGAINGLSTITEHEARLSRRNSSSAV